MAAALAADDLAAFNTASKPAIDATEALVKQLHRDGGDGKALDALGNTRHFHGFDSLKDARVAFQKFSTAATAVLEPLRRAGDTLDLQIDECPMVNQAIPDAPKKAHWIQTGGRALGNPFFGKEMPDCGIEIKP